MTVDDPVYARVRRQLHLVVALTVRDALLVMLITHAVVTVLFAPRRRTR